jgi:nucleotide-binding universal stress UspA family protein
MGASGPRTTGYLVLDNPTLNPVLARRLPRALACRYHALPVAEDKDTGRLTVAMADPTNAAAREALKTVLDAVPYVVKGDLAGIDALLAEVWPQEEQRPPRVLVCTAASPIADEVWAYARDLCDLVGGRATAFQMARRIRTSLDALAEEVQRGGYELVIMQEPGESPVERLLLGPVGDKVVDRVPTSVLLAHRPSWPLRRTLLIIRGKETDDRAVDWVVRLARPAGATVTVLAVVPPVPVMYSRGDCTQHGLAALLATNTPLGLQMREAAQRLVNCEIEGTLRLREGTPDYQIRRELAEGDYDLITITAETHGRWLRRLVGDVIGPLVRWADRPVLIAKPKGA